MSTPKQPPPDLLDLPSMVRKLRRFFEETQTQFAARLGVAVVTLARWETGRPPRGKWLDRLAELSESKGLDDYSEAFRRAKAQDLRGPGRPRHNYLLHGKMPDYRNQREQRYALALLRVLRNPEHYSKVLEKVERDLAPIVKEVDDRLMAIEMREDVKNNIIRNHEKGRSVAEIAAFWDLNVEDVQNYLNYNTMVQAITAFNQLRADDEG